MVKIVLIKVSTLINYKLHDLPSLQKREKKDKEI